MLKIFLTNLLFISYLFAIEKGEFYGSAQEKNPSWFKSSFLDLEEDINDATKKGKNIIIYFHQNGCPYCAKLIRDNFHNPVLVKKIKQNFEVIEINMFGDRELTDWNGKEFNEKTFAEHLKIQFTPSLLFLNPEKQIVLRLNGYQSTKKMHQVLDYLISKKYKTQTFANYKYNNKKTTGKLTISCFF
ncbi:thioredoxin SoxW [hydrothermal vent metagenome]|uniref:Thioredoxin SoxW n=1 Tax=hydrothermal vent metagenome TaxID=652676 RepID=A0A1W1CCR2_9ZZZZ